MNASGTHPNEGCRCPHIKGVSCNVKNCAYHDGACYCTAKEITVGPCNACTSGDTACATFKPSDKH